MDSAVMRGALKSKEAPYGGITGLRDRKYRREGYKYALARENRICKDGPATDPHQIIIIIGCFAICVTGCSHNDRQLKPPC